MQLNSDIITNISTMINMYDLTNLYNTNREIRNIIRNNSEFIITNIFNNYNIYIIKGETSISFKSDYRVLSILKTETTFYLERILEKKSLLKLINKELFII